MDQTEVQTDAVPSPWSKEAHDAKVLVNRPTIDNPYRLEFGDVTNVVAFSEVPGEILHGVVVGWFFNPEGDKVFQVELAEESRAIRAKEGHQFDQTEMNVNERAILSKSGR